MLIFRKMKGLMLSKKNPFQPFLMVPLKVLSPLGIELQASS